MNFYNPYLYSMPIESSAPSLLSKISLSSIINGTSKTLNLVNQAIPVVKQMSPIMRNMRTMFNVMNEFKKADIDSNSNIADNNNTTTIENKINTSNPDGPTFFI